MIRYSLECSEEHGFDGWFRSSADFDDQAAKGLVACPVCGSVRVNRALMAPAVRSSRDQATAAPTAASAAPTPVLADPFLADPRRAALMAAMRDLKAKVTAEADYVGPAFAEEARKMHYGEVETRGIWGEASGADVRGLVEEGIEVHALPVLPGERN